jgi:hypothetical protein
MKIPGLTANQALWRMAPESMRTPLANPSALGWSRYRLSYCTSALYATKRNPGHQRLRHCFLRIEDGRGGTEYWGHGRSGLVAEPHPDTPSTRCWPLAEWLSEGQRAALLRSLGDTAALGYRWGGNDCCSALATAHRAALGDRVPRAITDAARNLAASPEIFPSTQPPLPVR